MPSPRNRSVAAVRVAAASLEREAVMLAESTDGVRMLHIRVGIRYSDDDRPEAPVVAAARREHGGYQRITLVVAQRQEQRHFALYMRFEADLLLEINLGGRLEALYCLFFLLAKELLDSVAHAFGFYRGLGFG